MKKITFDLKNEKEINMPTILKSLNVISGKIKFDFDQGNVIAEDLGEKDVDQIIDLLGTYYRILSVAINNLEDTQTNFESNDREEGFSPEIRSCILQSHDPEIKNKIDYLQEILEKLTKTLNWAISKKGVSEYELGGSIYTIISEISMMYSGRKAPEVSVGDIVKCVMPNRLRGEFKGNRSQFIVIDKMDELVYVVPMIPIDKTAPSRVNCEIVPDDAEYNIVEERKNSRVLLDRGQYVSKDRIQSIVGKLKEGCLNTIFKKLSKVFYFSASEEEKADKKNPSNMGKEEILINEAIGFALDKLDKSKPIEGQIISFLEDIGMEKSETVIQAFTYSFNVTKICYDSIINEICKNSNKKPEIVKSSLKMSFEKWSKNYPDIAKSPRLSITSIIKVFVRRL